MKYTWCYKFEELGKITIKEEDNNIVSIDFGDETDIECLMETELMKKLKFQLDKYLFGEKVEFDVPIKLNGTEFQTKVWNELKNIKHGEVISYKDLANRINHPKSYRAVGNANSKNPLPIVIPCHRVIASDGSLAGYSGNTEKGKNIKRRLLNIEKVDI